MTFICPCCGSEGEERPSAHSLEHAKVPQLARRAIDALLRAYPRTMSMRRLADIVYSDDPNGGPDNAQNCLSVTFSRIRPELAKAGWRVGCRDLNRRNEGVIGIWPVERLNG